MKFTDEEVDNMARNTTRMLLEFDMCLTLPPNLAKPTQNYLANTMYSIVIMADGLGLTDRMIEIVRKKMPNMHTRTVKLFESFLKIHRKNVEEARRDTVETVEQSTIDLINRIFDSKK